MGHETCSRFSSLCVVLVPWWGRLESPPTVSLSSFAFHVCFCLLCARTVRRQVGPRAVVPGVLLFSGAGAVVSYICAQACTRLVSHLSFFSRQKSLSTSLSALFIFSPVLRACVACAAQRNNCGPEADQEAFPQDIAQQGEQAVVVGWLQCSV